MILHFDALRRSRNVERGVVERPRGGPSLSEARGPAPVQVPGRRASTSAIAGYAPEQVRDEIADAVAQTGGGRGLIVAPGCSVPTETPPANLRAFKEAVEAARRTGS
jgi:hypothetical protein